MNRFLGLSLLVLTTSAIADERILEFHSDIRVHVEGWIEVTETIKVRAEGNRIRRGIYRDQHTEYRDPFGNRYEASIKPLSVLRNDTRERFHSVNIDRGLRTYFGHKNRLIPNGVHTYNYRYRANRMLGFFDDHDELYWTVTGFDWAFPIDKASATVTLEFDAPRSEILHEAYTGPFGANSRDYTSRRISDGSIYFESTEPLSAVNGLTIVVGWPKSLVPEPTALQRIGWLVKDNKNFLAALVGFVLLLLYYIPVWRSHGKDPDEGPIVTRYEPPEEFSPASLRYIRQMYYDDKVMTAAVVNLAVKGYLSINKFAGEHSLKKLEPGPNPTPLAAGEKELYDDLFGAGTTIALENKNHKHLGKAKAAHRRSLTRRLQT